MDRVELLRAVDQVDVLDLAGRIIANPNRAMCSQAGKLALAYAVENFWAICVEADVLVHAIERTMPWDQPVDAELCETVALQAGHIRHLMAELRRETNTQTNTETNNQENEDGSRNA